MEKENIKENTTDTVLEEESKTVEEATEDTAKKEYNGPKVVAITEINYKAMKYYNMYALFYRRKIYIIYIVLVLIALGGAVFSFIQKNTLMGAVMGIFGLYMIYTAFTLEKKIDTNIANHFYHTRPTKLQIEITEEGLTLVNDKDPSQKNLYEWVYVSLIHELNDYYYFFINKQPIILDKDPNALLEGTSEELKAIIDKQIASKPYKRITKQMIKKPITFVQPVIEDSVPVETEANDVKVETEVESNENNEKETVEEKKDND